jgi:hypothetical protein
MLAALSTMVNEPFCANPAVFLRAEMSLLARFDVSAGRLFGR